jgi:16S rRNA (cytidine1402-2'-O)-methyltransferase
MGTLYIVATPIGNLEDITIRAVKTLMLVDAIACEDTRKTGVLLSRILPPPAGGSNTTNTTNNLIRPRLISYYEQNELQRIPEIINALKNGLNIALVSDAGTPTISDPGFKLVREAIKEGIRVESIPGPSSVISSLVSSGLPTDKFLFVGYPPKKPGHRKTLFENLTKLPIKTTIILFEGPHHIFRTLTEMKEIFGDIDIVICRELTKIHEEIRREKISSSIDHFSKTNPKGEFVILFNHSQQI